jgi:hypothetical protein
MSPDHLLDDRGTKRQAVATADPVNDSFASLLYRIETLVCPRRLIQHSLTGQHFP